MNEPRETDASTVAGVKWPGRFVGVAAGVVDPSGRILLVRHTCGRPNAVVDISRRTWLE